MIKFVCYKCKRETNPPKGFSFVECGNCGYITSESKARTEVPDAQPSTNKEQDQ